MKRITIKPSLKVRIAFFKCGIECKFGWRDNLKAFKDIFFPPKLEALFG